jgi:hypothetical protein
MKSRSPTISGATAREVIGCRGFPTVQVDLFANGELAARAVFASAWARQPMDTDLCGLPRDQTQRVHAIAKRAPATDPALFICALMG